MGHHLGMMRIEDRVVKLNRKVKIPFRHGAPNWYIEVARYTPGSYFRSGDLPAFSTLGPIAPRHLPRIPPSTSCPTLMPIMQTSGTSIPLLGYIFPFIPFLLQLPYCIELHLPTRSLCLGIHPHLKSDLN